MFFEWEGRHGWRLRNTSYKGEENQSKIAKREAAAPRKKESDGGSGSGGGGNTELLKRRRRRREKKKSYFVLETSLGLSFFFY